MGGCASKPKDLDLMAKSTAETPLMEKVAAETAPQEKNEGEAPKTEKDVEDPSDPKEEENKEADVDVVVSPEPVKATEPTEAQTSEDKSDEPLVTI